MPKKTTTHVRGLVEVNTSTRTSARLVGNIMNNDRLNPQPSWVTDVYMPEGADRPSHNPPITQSDEEFSSEKPATVAEVVSEANRTRKR